MVELYSVRGFEEAAKTPEGLDLLDGLLQWNHALAGALENLPKMEAALASEKERITSIKKMISEAEEKLRKL